MKQAWMGEHEPCTVYRLIDPRDKSVKYIGIAADTRQRRRGHLHGHPKLYPNQRKEDWIHELRTNGLEPILEPVEQYPTRLLARRAESLLIYLYRLAGADLLNNEFKWVEP